MDASSGRGRGRGGFNGRGRGDTTGRGSKARGRGNGAGRSGRGRGGYERGERAERQTHDENQDSSNQLPRHHGGGNGPNQRPRFDPKAPATTNQFERFILVGLYKCPPHKLQRLIQDAEALWNNCWRKVDELPIPQLRIVLAALTRIPASSSIEPPHIHNVRRGVANLVHELTAGATQQWSAVDLSDTKLEVVELVERVFARLTKFTWRLPRADVVTELTEMLSDAELLLESRHVAHRDARRRVSALFDELELEWTVKTIAPSNTASDAASSTSASQATVDAIALSWKNPTVAWLADWSHFQPQKLPKMKVPGGIGDGVYDSPDEYFVSTIKLWIGMTFVDGNNALLPHCSARASNDKVCDQPLWPMTASGAGGSERARCKSHHCSRHVEFMCANRTHDRGLCRLCALQRQELLRGPPSSSASTHIYDGTVTSMQYDGTLYMNEVASRKPPLAPVHWKTTKRLACPNLVGIVLLESRGNSLRLSDSIYWAKVALHGDSRDEFREREAGKLALTLLTYSSDASPNPLLDQSIPRGAAVAVIDCQTFVPEFIPVLTALEHQSAMPMSFHDGALLNLRRAPDIAESTTSRHYVQGCESDDDDSGGEIFLSADLHRSTIASQIQELVAKSALDPIVQIRRNGRLQAQLEMRLTSLVVDATLDSGQLESFMAALQFPVHCTQGPPGTGKSYLGVVVVRALLIVRQLWMTVSESVGAPPILVLSYKNHAIDEFLLDLVRNEPTMNHNTYRGMRGFTYRPLVRIGGGCSEPELFPYQEFNAASRKSAEVQRLADRIGALHALQDCVHRFRDRFTVIKESQFAVLDASGDRDAERVKRDKKVCHDAALELKRVGGAIITCSRVLAAPRSSDDDGDDDDDDDPQQRALDAAHALVASTTRGLGHADIPLLYDGIRHYDPSMDPAQILHYWVSGFVPQPACAVDDCEDISDGSSDLCVNHRCIYTQLVDVRTSDVAEHQCTSVVVEHRNFCTRHLCTLPHCEHPRAAETQLFCSDHACFVCIADARVAVAREAREEPPRNVCADHTLCWATGEDGYCMNLALPDDSYCKLHVHSACQVTKHDGTPCNGYVVSRADQYCFEHLATHRTALAAPKHTVASSSSSPLPESSSLMPHTKCHAKNAKGKPCGSPPLSGTKFCPAHRSKASVADVEAIAESRAADEHESKLPPATTSAVSDLVITTVDTPLASETPAEQADTEPPVCDSTADAGSTVMAVDDTTSRDDEHIDEEVLLSCSSEDEADFDADTFDFDNYDEVEESEHLQHLREVDEVADVVKPASASDDSADPCADDVSDDASVFAFDMGSAGDGVAATTEWSWAMPIAARWASVTALLGRWSPLAQQLAHALKLAISSAKRELYFEELKLRARAFEGKAVIGGTITGCVARLEAIRATNPFAILVEEASEVLEPLLFSCLCSSTCKLEMIGDHLQLQPSVMAKFDFERVNRINISMFERLICAPPTSPVPASVLSIQRRMRRDICDLTRTFYADITAIEDHAVCLTKTLPIASPVKPKYWTALSPSKPTLDLVALCEGEGREVPGVAPHLFFWKHTGAEERARVGLSRINPNEAEMACALANYLVTCGVPMSSIAILTPYKGQLMLIRDLIMRKYKLVKLVKQTYGASAGQQKLSPACVLSTVDRFQGDEADIVIVSLVIDGKSRTPFVKLQNRMIVLLSRARIGMYVIGNTTYFGETPHWRATFDLLRQSVGSDNAVHVDATCRVYDGTRIGTSLPLCCPQHRTSTALATKAEHLRLAFCQVVCDESLACSHVCGLRCHWPNVTAHNNKCQVEVESPCARHPRVLPCSYFTAATGCNPIAKALPAYRCDVDVDLQLPCSHEQQVHCADAVDIRSGAKRWPTCTERAITPYVYPVCKHYRACSCIEFDRFSAGGAPPCEKKEQYVAPCGHSELLACHRKSEVVAAPSKFVCRQSVRTQLPRCGHTVVTACPIARTFERWSGAALTTPGIVCEGVQYGAKDHSCTERVVFRRHCGHDETMTCEQAFDIACAAPPCRTRVTFANPECGHMHETTCTDAKRLVAIVEQQRLDDDDDELARAPVTHVHDADRAAVFRDFGLAIRCIESVVLTRKCGHSEAVACNVARYLTTACTARVLVPSPRCGHDVQLPCEHTAALTQWKPWEAARSSDNAAVQQAVTLLLENGVLQDTLPAPLALPPALTPLVKDCEHSLLLRRSKSCGHELRMKCTLAIKTLDPTSTVKVPACTELVMKQRKPCGHEVKTPCHNDISKSKCTLRVDKPCWNAAQCKSVVKTTCSASSPALQCDTTTVWTCARGHDARIQVCKQGMPEHCPTCSHDDLQHEIAATQSLIAMTKSAIAWPPREAVQSVLSLPHMLCPPVLIDRAHRIDFYERKLSLLKRFQRSINTIKDIWSRPLFQPKAIPIVAVRTRQSSTSAAATSVAIKSFEIKDFGDTSAPGIHVREATYANVEALVAQRREPVQVVFGVAYSLGVCADSSGFPRKAKQLAAEQARWVNFQRDKFGFDMLFTPLLQGNQKTRPSSSTSSVGTLSLWEPYAAFPTHELVLPPREISAVLARHLPADSVWRVQTRLVTFARPWLQAVQVQPAGSSSVHHTSTDDSLDKLEPLLTAEFPWAQGIRIAQSWDGKALCIGGASVLSLALENDLRGKLQFVPAALSAGASSTAQKAKASGARMFAGISLVNSIEKQLSLHERGLLLALENLAINKTATQEAETHLAAYVAMVKHGSSACHPLVLLALARLAARRQKTRVQPTELLKVLRELYPLTADAWLTPSESALLDSMLSRRAVPAGASSTYELTVADKWRLLQQQERCASDAMDELLKMVGLRRVKDAAFKLFKSALALKKMDAAKRTKNAPAMNYVFLGNPGTGKTTVARLFARILHDSGMRRTASVAICGAQKLKDDGASKFRDIVAGAMGGVVFIDEAYELDPMGDAQGKPIVAELLTAAEDKRNDLSIILAGYEDDIQQKLYRYNDGIQSRFEEIHFDDFDEADLRVVWDGLLESREWVADSTVGKIACRRVARGAGVKGFGNARAVRKLFEQSVQTAMARPDFTGITELRTADVLGERPTINPKLQAVLQELDNKIGWRAVKDKVAELVAICEKNYERELLGVDPIPVTMNRLFLGNPGTGKTTCAALYGRVLKCLNFLSIGDVVKKTAGDFVGQFVGQSQKQTVDILKLAKGKVLLIDEAYNLNDSMFGKQVLDVLVEKVQGTESDDIAVVLIGYEYEMTEMLRTQNPGLARRFPVQYAFYFDDYTERELLDILLAACARKNVHCPLDVSARVMRQLALQKTQANFGNAGAVELILKNAIANASLRPLGSDSVITLRAEDIDDDVAKRARASDVATMTTTAAAAQSASATDANPLAVLDALYRVEHIKAALAKIETSIQVAQDEGSEIPKIGHFVFRGSPGTGKTTVARAIATIFHRMGILGTDKLVETSGLNLTGEYVGQTKKRVEEQLGKARGGVLFIDEAYELGKGHFGEEAMTALVAAMTNPTYAGMVIVIAGYPRDLDEMLDRNAGLKSRFTRFLDFHDWTTHDCVKLMIETSRREGFELSSDALGSVRCTFNALRGLPMFGNGRDVMQLWSELLDCRAQRVRAYPELIKTITLEDAEAANRVVLAGRTPVSGAAMQQRSLTSGPAAVDDACRDAPLRIDASATSSNDAQHESDSDSDSDSESNDLAAIDDKWSRIERDPDVAANTWAELERAKRANDAMMRAVKDAADKVTQDAARRKLAEFVAAQEKLRRLSKCPMGFVWLQVGGGWRCAGGSHFVSDAELQRSFSH